MEFVFDIQKSIAAAAYICRKNNGEIELRELLKMLYYADRIALLEWGRTITGDRFFSLPQGPVVSRIYDLARYRERGSEMEKWQSVFTPRDGHKIKIREGTSVDTDPLSQREEEALDTAFQTIRDLIQKHGEKYIHQLHEMLPEWQNPNGSSILIEPSDILRIHGEDDDTIREIENELDALNSAKLALQARG